MENRLNRIRERFPFLLFFTGTSLAIGIAIPVIYELQQSPYARQSITRLSIASIATLLITLIACALMAWVRKPRNTQIEIPQQHEHQFNISGILFATTLVAVAIAVTRWLNESFSLGLLGACLLACFSWAFFQSEPVRIRVLVLMVNMFLPFTWVIAFRKPFGSTTGLLIGLLIGPGLLPAEIIRVFISDSRPQDSVPLAIAFAIVQLGLGMWLAKISGKLSMAYALLALTASSIASFAFHAMYRM